MICITDLMKASGKKIAEWKRLPSTKAYLDEVLIEMGFSHINQIIYSEKVKILVRRDGLISISYSLS